MIDQVANVDEDGSVRILQLQIEIAAGRGFEELTQQLAALAVQVTDAVGSKRRRSAD